MRALDPRLVRRVRPVRVALAADVCLGLVGAAALLAQVVLVAGVIAAAFVGAPVAPLGASVQTMLVALAAAIVVRAGVSGAEETIGRWAAGRVMSELRRALVRQRLSGRSGPSGGQSDPVQGGELATAAVAGVDALEVYLARYLPQLVLAGFVPVAVLAIALAVDPVSAAVMLVTLPAIPVFLALVGRSSGDRARARWAALSRLSNHVLDVVRGLPTLRAYNRAEAQAELIAVSGEQYRATTMQVLRLSFVSGAVLDLAATIGTALVAVTVGVRMVAGEVTLWAGLVVLLLTPELYAPLRALGTLFHASADGVAAAGRILDVLEPDDAATDALPPNRNRAADADPAADADRLRPPDWRRIRLEGVTVRHPGRGGSGLRNVDLDLCRGEVVALVGPSGAGKSTLATVLLGLREPDAGRVTVDGHDLAALDPAWWRSQIGWLPQRPTMFRGTIHENIAVGDPLADDERVEEVARLAGVDLIAAELRLGYRTAIGPGGLALSMGEQRRVALARALVRGAPLLILDEPTAHLDPEATTRVAEAISRAAPDRAVLVIEHHPDLVPAVDRVVALRAPEEPEPIPTSRVPVGTAP